MFKKSAIKVSELIPRVLREGGLESPLQQRRLLDAWEQVAGEVVTRYTKDKYIRNQTLFVKISSPALRADLSMMKSRLMQKLNESVGAMVIADIRFV